MLFRDINARRLHARSQIDGQVSRSRGLMRWPNNCDQIIILIAGKDDGTPCVRKELLRVYPSPTNNELMPAIVDGKLIDCHFPLELLGEAFNLCPHRLDSRTISSNGYVVVIGGGKKYWKLSGEWFLRWWLSSPYMIRGDADLHSPGFFKLTNLFVLRPGDKGVELSWDIAKPGGNRWGSFACDFKNFSLCSSNT
jgi:hypothetical protein